MFGGDFERSVPPGLPARSGARQRTRLHSHPRSPRPFHRVYVQPRNSLRARDPETRHRIKDLSDRERQAAACFSDEPTSDQRRRVSTPAPSTLW